LLSLSLTFSPKIANLWHIANPDSCKAAELMSDFLQKTAVFMSDFLRKMAVFISDFLQKTTVSMSDFLQMWYKSLSLQQPRYGFYLGKYNGNESNISTIG
jgi:hypothetical protein